MFIQKTFFFSPNKSEFEHGAHTEVRLLCHSSFQCFGPKSGLNATSPVQVNGQRGRSGMDGTGEAGELGRKNIKFTKVRDAVKQRICVL